MLRPLRELVDVLKSIDRHLHVIARAHEAEALSNNSFGTDKQCYTEPKSYVRHTVGGVYTGSLKDDEPQCSLREYG